MMFFKYRAYDPGFGLRTTYFLAAALALSAVPKLSPAREKPNIVIIVADGPNDGSWHDVDRARVMSLQGRAGRSYSGSGL